MERERLQPTYRHAHWYFLAALAAIVAGFWPSFFRPLGAGDFAHSVHGVTATLWIVALATQSWLMSRGLVAWHRRVAWGALLLLPVMVVSALGMVAVMFSNPEMPPFLPPLLAFIDLPSVVFLIVLVMLALLNVRTPAAHKRFMAATVLLAFPPALTRLYARVLAPQVDFMMALHGSIITVEVILIALIVADRRAGERRLAYPLSLGFFVAMHALMLPVASSALWGRLMSGYTKLFAVLLLCGVAATPAQAQRLTGVVVDSAGRAVVDADVLIGTGTHRDRTDSTGRFTIARVPTGDQRLKVRRIGYRPYELNIRLREDSVHTVRVVLQRMPQMLGAVRIVDANTCPRNTLAGFECRRRGGVGVFRDAGELRAMRPSAWADMLDGIPTLRRVPVSTPDGLDYRVASPPSGCLVEIYNGEDPMFDGHVRRVPTDHLVPRDVVALEYYRFYEDVPEPLKRFAWPKETADSVPVTSPCSLLVYWLRIAEKPRRR